MGGENCIAARTDRAEMRRQNILIIAGEHPLPSLSRSKRDSRYVLSGYAFVLAIAFWPSIEGAATSPRWAIAALSLWFLEWYCLPFVAVCFAVLDFDQACHWTIICAAFCWGLKNELHQSRTSRRTNKWWVDKSKSTILTWLSYLPIVANSKIIRGNDTAGTVRTSMRSPIATATALQCDPCANERFRTVIQGFAIGIGINGCVAILQLAGYTGIPQAVSPGGLFLNKNILGEAACLAFVAALLIRAWPFALLSLPGIILSNSRSAWLAACVGIFFSLPSLSWRVLAACIFVACGLALWWFGIAADTNTLMQRFMLWHIGLTDLHLFGSGSFDYSTIQHREPNMHNDWIQLVYELGIVGIIPIAVVFRAGLNGALPFAAALFALASFGFPLHMPATAWFSAFIVGHYIRRRNDESRIAVCQRLAHA